MGEDAGQVEGLRIMGRDAGRRGACACLDVRDPEKVASHEKAGQVGAFQVPFLVCNMPKASAGTVEGFQIVGESRTDCGTCQNERKGRQEEAGRDAGQVGKREGLRACRSWEGKPESIRRIA